MSWAGKILGGAFGLFVGGPLGALFGVAFGHQFDVGMDRLEGWHFKPGGQQRIQMAFFTATFSIMGHVAKADGQVSQAEIDLASRVMEEMGLTGDMRQSAIKLFQEGKRSDFPLQETLQQFRQECHHHLNLVRMFLEIQIQSALADGSISSREDRLLLQICAQLGISRFDYQRLKLQLQAQQRFYQKSHYRQRRGGAVTSQPSLQDAYAVLGITAAASDGEVKKAYRRLISQHHPDKLVARGLPEEMMTMAKEKTQKIRKAYEIICAARK